MQMRQLGFAAVDLALHIDYAEAKDGDVMDYGNRILQHYAASELPKDYGMLAGFLHLFSHPVGYAAGYYSYKWAEVLEADAFQRFVFARLPGRTTPGFVTGSFKLTLRDGVTHDVLTVYVPTNHLYVGDVVILPAEDVVETDLSVEDGVSLLLSAGASVPLSIKEK